MSTSVCLRGVFDFTDHKLTNPYRDIAWERWIVQQSCVPYGVPRYVDRESAYLAVGTIPSNYKISCVDSWSVLENVVLPFLRDTSGANMTFPIKRNEEEDTLVLPSSVEEMDTLFQQSKLKMNCDKFGSNVDRTVHMIWNVLRCGIVVSIRKGRVVCFCPFYNPEFTNSWPVGVPSGADKVISSSSSAATAATAASRTLPVNKWWANGGILCTEAYPWGTHFCLQLKDMIAETAARFDIDDCTFCINKRDYPQYKYNPITKSLVEPYGFLFDRDDTDPFQDIPLSIDGSANDFLPMFSFYGGNRFLDLLLPPSEDFEASTRCVYLPEDTYNTHLSRSAIRDLTNAVPATVTPLSSKRGVAFFRGSATGSGTTPLTNQRLRLFTLAQAWQSPKLDVGCVSLRQRFRKHYSEPLGIVEQIQFPVSEAMYVPMAEQIQNKYLLYVEGHCAACRLGVMLGSGSVVFKVESSCVASELWFTHMLTENEHYISIASDFSNLLAKIDELEANPLKAQAIANNSRAFWEKYLSHDGVVKYMGVHLSAVCS